MKHSILFIAYIVYCVCAMSQSQDQNYIRTKTMTDETDPTKFIESIQYFDGLGRPVQTVQVGITPEHNSLVTLQEYDACGRNVATWLPAVISGKDGAFTGSPEVKSAAIASNINDSKPYSKTIYETSPLNRILEQYGPGANWHNSSSSIKTGYLTNESTSNLACMYFKINGSGLNTSLAKAEVFKPGVLYVTQTQNEAGSISYEFKNQQGQVILTRQMDFNEAYDTYYVYDDFGNLSYVIPPILADKILKENKSTTDNSLEIRQYASATNPDYKHQRERDRKNKVELDQNQANVAKSIKDNITATTPSGDPLGKRDPNNWGKGALIPMGIAIGTEIGVQLTNPDPSKDANEVRKEQTKQNQDLQDSHQQNKQEDNILHQLFNWLLN